MSLMLNALSKHNTVNKESNKRRESNGALSKKENKKNSEKPNPVSSQTYEVSSSDGEYIVPEASDNGDDNYSNE